MFVARSLCHMLLQEQADQCPYFSYFSLLFDPEPYFSLLYKKNSPTIPTFGVSCCQIKYRTLKTCL